MISKFLKDMLEDVWLRLFVAALVLAALWQIWAEPKTWHTDSWPLTIVTIAIAGPLIVHPALMKRLRPTGVKLPFVEVTFANPYEPSDETEQPDSGDHAPVGDDKVRWVGAQMKLQWKLAYLIKHTIPAYEDARKPTMAPHVAFANIGSLLYDKYVDAAEAERIDFVLTSPWSFIASQPGVRRAELLADAENLAQTVRAKVLKRMVMKDLNAAPDSLSIEKEDASGKLFVRRPGGQLVVVWPTWGQPQLSLVKDRLSELSSGRIVVTPFGTPIAPVAAALAGGVQLVSLANLPSAVGT